MAEKCIQDLIDYLRGPCKWYIYRSYRDYIATTLELYLKDLEFKKSIVSEKYSQEDIISRTKNQLEEERVRVLKAEEDFNKAKQEIDQLRKQKEKLRSFLSVLLKFAKDNQDSLNGYLFRHGIQFDNFRSFTQFMEKLTIEAIEEEEEELALLTEQLEQLRFIEEEEGPTIEEERPHDEEERQDRNPRKD
ncbi:hypothetical protein FDP41_013714 [Naegleria fowleri]|uniref:Uncharacterized protein n=1 Tax=Naegleria fowleri TaxID=5763 RepID=A0A6A5C3R2_NAEFO|nr:uncharacterized protein FDP41_013714 [Naegleria fowleri]KAF0980500.1 hypothetical protein FDP41_013714 [Naegleria fowleri]CAG4713911.1 unnamed protein product [Naegleria fowleri]